MTRGGDKHRPAALNPDARSGSPSSASSTDSSSLKQPRTPRFAEATSVYSPIDPPANPFRDPDEEDSTAPVKAKPGEVGFGYLGTAGMADDEISRVSPAPAATTAGGVPLKSALKPPGVSRTFDNPLSPTFNEETILEKKESVTAKEQKRDLLIKARVRMAKFALRGVNFSCSLIILAMLSTSFSIFNATRSLAMHGTFSPWAPNTNTWPQILVLTMACISLAACIIVFVAYFRGGHRRAEKVATYYTLFAIGWFIFSMVLWAVTAALYQNSRGSTGNKDMWGWSCAQNPRAVSYGDEVDYALICRLQNWALICIIIEIVVDAITILLYSIVFYRYWSKRRLHKTMDMRDKARSDLYLAQLRTQSAPNTPGFAMGAAGPRSPALSQYAMSPRFPPKAYRNIDDVEASPFTPGGVGPATAEVPRSRFESSFRLQAPPPKAPSATPRTSGPTSPFLSSGNPPARSLTPPEIRVQQPGPSVDDEPRYESVAIPGAYADAAPKSATH